MIFTNKLAAAAVAALLSALPAQAVTLNFVVTGDYSASFQLDSSPSPDQVVPDLFFVIYNISGFTTASGLANVYFFDTDNGGGIAFLDVDAPFAKLLVTDGPKLFSGSTSAPTFQTGTSTLTEFEGPGAYTLTITDPTASGAVPEPATWALMIGGFAMVGATMRRRQKVAVTFQRT